MTTRRQFLKGTAGGVSGGVLASRLTPAFANGTRVSRTISLEQAQALHNTLLIIDGHNDVPVERIHRGENPIRWKQRDLAYHTDIPRMKEGGYDVGFFIVGDGPTANIWITIEQVLEQIEADPEDLVQVLSSEDVVRAERAGKIGVLMAIEGVGPWLDGKLEVLGILHRLGVRSVGVTHGEGGSERRFLQGTKSPYGRCTPADREAERKNAGGLTPFGKEVVRTNHELSMVTDLAHINDRAFYEVVESASRPPIMSHTAVFSLCHQWRCLTDDQIKALAGAGGVMGIAFAPQFIDDDPKQATIDRLVEHICYVADLAGIDHVGIGSDYDGLGDTRPVVPEVSQLVHLTHGMLAHGMSEDEIRKVWGGNFLRVLRKNIDAPRQNPAR